MISKLRSNFRLANVLVRIAFVLTYVLYSWQNILSTMQVVLQMYGLAAGEFGTYTLLMAIFASLLIGAVLMLVVPLVANVFLNFSHFYNVPRAEYKLLTLVFCTLFFLGSGVISLVNLITPLFLTWGEKIVPFFVATGCAIGFYAVTKKLYFNDVTAPYYFRNLVIVYFIVAFLFGVVL